MIQKTFDIDSNITINQLLTFLKKHNLKLISLNSQYKLPNQIPSITIFGSTNKIDNYYNLF